MNRLVFSPLSVSLSLSRCQLSTRITTSCVLQSIQKSHYSLLSSSTTAHRTRLLPSTQMSQPIKRNVSEAHNQRIMKQITKEYASPSKSDPPPSSSSWLSRFLADRPEYEKYSREWWWEKFVVCVVFAITGSATTLFVKPILTDVLLLEGSMLQGPWSYRVAYFVVITPIYSLLLVTIGTLFGRHAFFRKFAAKMWTRMLPKGRWNAH
eukprot:TRINITY_DN1916_c0_g1_i1.p1 TRINITY_DN1916_c0_g1~~TRINITY_DN1916_c0_g1_i1.p1  ORF type:complete len:231 (-),score=23.54 TRINITY_DN1916_c0_g1_i1:73-696(-)